MGRFILTQNYRRLMGGEMQTYNASTAFYGCFRVHDINDVSDDNWIARTFDGTKKKVHRINSSDNSDTLARYDIGDTVGSILRFQSPSNSNIFFGTGGLLLDEDSYTADESAGYATTLTKGYIPSSNRLVVTYTNSTNTPISFDQMHCALNVYLTDTLQTTSITPSKVMYWVYDFGETITVAAGETVTFSVRLL